MKCVICKQGQTKPGFATVTLTKDTTTIIIKDVPADICENCGEYYLDENVTDRIQEIAQKALISGAEVEILKYAA